MNVCPANVAVHEIVYGAARGWRALKENGRAVLVVFSVTIPLVRGLPSTEMVTSKMPEAERRVIGAEFEIFERVRGASTSMETDDVSVDVASSGRYGRIAGEHLKARRGVADLLGIGNWPP